MWIKQILYVIRHCAPTNQTSSPCMRNARSDTIPSTVLLTWKVLINQSKTDAFITPIIWIACVTDVDLIDHIDLVELVDIIKLVNLIDLVDLIDLIDRIELIHRTRQNAGS